MKNVKKNVSANEPKTRQEPLKHHNWPFLTTFQSTKVIRNPPGGFRPKKKKSQILPFLECGNRTFNRASNFLEFSEIFKLEWIMSGYDLAPIKPKTTSLYLSRNNWSNSAPAGLPPKCFQPKISKSPCICLGNIKCQKKVSANEPKWRQDPSKHQHWPFQTAFQSTKVIRDPPRGFRPKPLGHLDTLTLLP